MKKIVLCSLFVLLTVLSGVNAKASGYMANDNLVDQLLADATETTFGSFEDFTLSMNPGPVVASVDDRAIVAAALDFFLGYLGVHRFYLGTEILTGLAYPITCGGFFGIVPLIDFVVILVNIEDVSQFVDNPKFFMW